MRMILMLAIAGAFGTLSRYGLGGLTQRVTGTGFPYGTLIINVLGCFVMGFVIQLALHSSLISPSTRMIITIGFLGAFTTFSTFSFDTTEFLNDGAWLQALLNLGLNLGLGMGATVIGSLLGKVTAGRI